jgi:hypothetical protein
MIFNLMYRGNNLAFEEHLKFVNCFKILIQMYEKRCIKLKENTVIKVYKSQITHLESIECQSSKQISCLAKKA